MMWEVWVWMEGEGVMWEYDVGGEGMMWELWVWMEGEGVMWEVWV